MTITDHPDILLAAYDDLSDDERASVDVHLDGCPSCREALALYQQQDYALRTLPQAPAPLGLASAVRKQTAPSAPRRTWAAGLGTLAAVAALIGSVTLPLHQEPPPASASGLPLLRQVAASVTHMPPNSGAAEIAYQALDFGAAQVPDAAKAIGRQHAASIRWTVVNPWHFRVDVRVKQPVLDAGTVTYVRNGTTITMYDSRTGRARQGHMKRGTRSEAQFLLTLIRSGSETLRNLMWTGADKSVSQFVADLSRYRSAVHPALFAQNSGTDRVAGLRAHVVKFGPLQTYDYVTGCSFIHPGSCMHHPRGYGVERVWIADDFPMTVRAETSGIIDSPRFTIPELRYTVTRLHLGSASLRSVTQWQPPVNPKIVKDPINVSGQGYSNPSDDLIRVPMPDADSKLVLVQDEHDEMFPNNVMGSRYYGKPYTNSRTTITFGTSPGGADGPYVMVQERLRAHGPPQALRQGSRYSAGTCVAYSGTHSDGQRCTSFRRGPVTVLVSTNALSVTQLRQYAKQICWQGAHQ